MGDSDPFGNKNYLNYEVEINNQVDRELNQAQKRELGQKADKIRAEIEDGFRQRGIVEFYQQLEKDVQGGVEVAVKLIREKITNYLINPDFGIDYAGRFLDELKKILDEFKVKFSEKALDSAKVNRSRQNLTTTLDTVRKKEVGFAYMGFQQDRQQISFTLKDYLITLAGLTANKYGLNLLAKIIPEIGKIQQDLGICKQRFSELSSQLDGTLQDLLEQLNQGTQENGRVIFNEIGLDELVNQVNHQVIKSEIENRILFKQGQQELDLTQIIKQHNLEALFYQAAYDWVCSDAFPVDVGRLTLYDKFINQYPNPDERQKILNEAKRLSGSFLNFSPPQVQLNPQITPTSAEIITVPNLVNNQGQTGNQGRPNHLVIVDDIKNVGVYEIKNGNDQDRITFLQEKKAFPLRFIECLETLGKRYEYYPHKQALHIDKRVVPKLYNLYLLTQVEQQQIRTAEEVFVLARSLDWIILQKNQSTNRNEIRYDFEQAGLLGIQRCVLGYEWEEVFTTLVTDAIAQITTNEQIRIARQLLTDNYQQKSREARLNSETQQEIESKLKIYLGERLQEYGIDNPLYQKHQKIANRILTFLRS